MRDGDKLETLNNESAVVLFTVLVSAGSGARDDGYTMQTPVSRPRPVKPPSHTILVLSSLGKGISLSNSEACSRKILGMCRRANRATNRAHLRSFECGACIVGHK
jgi:hypothetical protein